jgi:adenine phosphoribosyltransferase
MNLEQQLSNTIRDIPDFPKPGIIFKDITPILKDVALCNKAVDRFLEFFENKNIEAVAGIEARGFLFGILLANKLGVPFVPIRKSGKLPYETISEEYTLEYGVSKIEMHKDAFNPKMRVLLHDDLLATGGSAEAAAKLIVKSGAEVIGFSFLVELGFLNGKSKLEKYSNSICSLINYNKE